ncbi:MAG: hypothetical protein IMZ75_08190, partial [Actinobacteria bacterium]|nr:hypothetical protein [Actinomycetota bacterium]
MDSNLKALEKLAKVELVVLDDWGVAVVGGQAANDRTDVVDNHAGCAASSTRSRGTPAGSPGHGPRPTIPAAAAGQTGRPARGGLPDFRPPK